MTTSALCAKALWPLVSKHPLPRIHLLSDLHLETGPYEIPSYLDYDILVAAGDIGPIEQAVAWLASLNKPVVYVLGNHEFWGRSLGDAVNAARKSAKGTQVHVLERNAVIIQGVRFLGATYWTSYGDWHAGLVEQALRGMRDNDEIGAANWYASASNIRWKRSMMRRLKFRVPTVEECKSQTEFHPTIAYQLHLKTKRWLAKQLHQKFDGPTAVVTHHAPSFASLRAAGISNELLDATHWTNRDEQLVRVGCYASPMSLSGAYKQVDMWLHGHIHTALDVLDEDVRVLCNPRGHHVTPLTAREAKGFAFFGLALSEKDIAASQASSRENPFRGDARGFDPLLVIDFTHGYQRPLQRIHDSCVTDFPRVIEQAKEAAPFAHRQSRVGKWARRSFNADVHEFRDRASEFLRRTLRPLWGGRMALWHEPPLPLPPIDSLYQGAVPQSAFAQCIESMKRWASWADTVPTITAVTLTAWATAGCRVLGTLEQDFQCNAWLQMLPARALRALDEIEFRLHVERPWGTRDEMHASVMNILRTYDGHATAHFFVYVLPIIDCAPDARDRLLSRETLQSVLCSPTNTLSEM